MLRIVPEEVKVPVRHQFMLGAISPRPIAFVSTIDEEGRPNLSPYSFFNAVGSNPATIIFSPALSGRTAQTKDTLLNIRATGEAVVNIVNYSMVQQMSLASSPYPRGVNEFEKAGFTMVASEIVRPFRVGESHVQMECKVKDIIATGSMGGAGNIVIAEIVLMHIDEKVLDADGKIDPYKMDYVSRMGGNYYSRVIPESIFELVQPKDTMGMGMDQLPAHIKNSSILTGNQLGALANLESMPTQEAVDAFLREHPEYAAMHDAVAKHTAAAALLDQGEVTAAFCLLLTSI